MRTSYHHNLGAGFFFAFIFAFFMVLSPSISIAEEAVSHPDEKEITVSGTVEKAAIDEKGEVIAVEIWVAQGDAYDYYLVNDTPDGNALLGLVGAKVTATGILEEDEDGNKILTVKKYSVLK
ncbi:MAG: hypothetical protein HY098_09365 [Nitrospinae bacterium]|nr:hypothetical protein [Nitrospinota bacterium]